MLKNNKFVYEAYSEILSALSQFVRFFRSKFKSLFNLFSDLLMISRFVLSAKWWTLQCFITTCRSWIYIRKSKDPKTDPCCTPHVILEVLHSKPLTDTNCLCFAKYDSNHLFAANPQWHNDIISSTECYDWQYQKPVDKNATSCKVAIIKSFHYGLSQI